MDGRFLLFSLALSFLCSACTEPVALSATEQTPTPLAESHDAAATGTIQGRVTWTGDVPVSQEHVVRALPFNPHIHKNPARYTTPHVPMVNVQNKGIANAVVYLRGVEPAKSREWDHLPVRVEFQDRRLLVRQGDVTSSVGFVRKGCAIEIVNRDSEFHNLHARGAAFFAAPLVESNRIEKRILSKSGVVELSCGAGYYWLHAHLFVCDHPYCARTDADGNFMLKNVPAGSYEAVCWLPSWHARKEVDPETGITARQAWEPPSELTRSVAVHAGSKIEMNVIWSNEQFLLK